MQVRFSTYVIPTNDIPAINTAAEKVISGDKALDRLIKLYKARLDLGESDQTERQLSMLLEAHPWRLNKIAASIKDVDLASRTSIDSAIRAIEKEVMGLSKTYAAYNDVRRRYGQPTSDEVERRECHMNEFAGFIRPVSELMLFRSNATGAI